MQNNTDKLDHLIALAASKCLDEEAKALMDIDTSDVQFDDEYYRKKKKVINKYKRRRSPRLAKTVAIRVAAAIMIMITLTCALIGCVPKWRRAIYNAIVEWYEDCFAVRYEATTGEEAETRYPETTEAEPEEANAAEPEETKPVPEYIEEVRKPRDLPEGVWEDVVMQTRAAISLDYYNNEEYIFSFSQRLLKLTDNHVDGEAANVTHIIVNGNEATVVEYINKNEIYILWSDGEYSYYIVSTECDLETLIVYAESVK